MFQLEAIKSFNDLEFSVYDYVMKNKNTVVYMRIRELADEAHVSTTTVLRFCKKLGCDGFSEFKIKLKMYLENEENFNVKNDKSIIVEFLNRADSNNFKNDLEKASIALKEAKYIFCIGFGSSGAMANYASRYFAGLGKFSLPITDPYYPTESVYVEGSVTLAFSVSGESKAAVMHTNRMKSAGGKIISITNSKNCTIANLADIKLAYYVPQEKYGINEATTQIPVLYIVEDLGKRMKNL
ncbi:MurR/RpiR family transcriptional regulator [Clostridium sp.]|uniref:MurR/RpiR family transcriptional regulator n=1 Tax=Clostridium sp. TaxID=1506 RepID=UPI0026DD6DB7|nr:MurR/RpiR family transcriptional regulator [Clostridium sp.]MDO5039984.1 MurR/RpiR family transcriptional regulator [Clostridium sp.]